MLHMPLLVVLVGRQLTFWFYTHQPESPNCDISAHL
jgi:hypothetical protein